MKKLFFALSIMLLTISTIHCQPNTKTEIEVGIVDAQPGKVYRLFLEIKQDTTQGELINGMDYLNPNVANFLVTLPTPVVSGDTLLYSFEFPDQPTIRYLKGGLVQVDLATTKYSAMTVSNWVGLDTIETMQAGFFVRRKN